MLTMRFWVAITLVILRCNALVMGFLLHHRPLLGDGEHGVRKSHMAIRTSSRASKCPQLTVKGNGDQQQHGGQTTATTDANSCSDDDSDDLLPDHFISEATVAWVQLMLDSWESQVLGGEPLIPDRSGSSSTEVQQAQQLANLRYAVVSHDFLRNKEDPIFVYANTLALQTFGYEWDEFVQMPSRKSCGEEGQEERSAYLRTVLEDKEQVSAANYSGVRLKKSGESFLIAETVLWNVIDQQGNLVGQACRIASSTPLP